MRYALSHHENKISNDRYQTIVNTANCRLKSYQLLQVTLIKKTEVLMGYFMIYVNGNYVIITNDIGVGNDYLEPPVGDF